MGTDPFIPRLLSHALDSEAANGPDRLVCIHPVSLQCTDLRWRPITIANLAHAVDNLAWWIEKHVAPRGTSEKLAYIGPNDIRYALCVLACMKLGHCVLLAHENSKLVVDDILLSSGHTKLLFAQEYGQDLRHIQNNRDGINAWPVMGLWELFDTPSTPFPSCNEYTTSKEKEPVVILYSSGTTGSAKEIALPHGYFSVLDFYGYMPVPPGRSTITPWLGNQKCRRLVKTKLFHVSGLIAWTMAIFHRTSFVLAPEIPLTPELLRQVVAETEAQTALLSPEILTDLSSSAAGLDSLSALSCISFAGMPLPPAIGDRISHVTCLRSIIGSTEVGVISTLAHESENWEYLEWNPNFPLEMREHGDGCFQLVILRPAQRYMHAAFFVLPNSQELCTGDLFMQHPRRPELWKHVGRVDDVLKLKSRVRLNPTPVQLALQGHEWVSKAVITTDHALELVLIVDPNWKLIGSQSSVNTVVDSIWPLVEKVNGDLPSEAKIRRDHILVAPISKPFKTTSKGSVQRHLVLQDYVKEIEDLSRV